MYPVNLGPPANPADTQYIPRPEWYYLPIFQWLKYWHGSLSVIGVLVIPGILIACIIALPFFDRSVERRPWKRPVAMTAYAVVALALIGLGVRSRAPIPLATSGHRWDPTQVGEKQYKIVTQRPGGGMADAEDLKSSGDFSSCGFDSHPGYQFFNTP